MNVRTRETRGQGKIFRILQFQRFTATHCWMSKDPGHCAGHSEVIPMRLDQLPPPLLVSPDPAVSIAPHPTVPAIVVSPSGGPPGLCEGSYESLAFDQLCHIIWECETAVHVEMWGLASRFTWRPYASGEIAPSDHRLQWKITLTPQCIDLTGPPSELPVCSR